MGDAETWGDATPASTPAVAARSVASRWLARFAATGGRPSLGSVVLAARGGAGIAARAVADLLYPPSCLACRAAVGSAHALCPGCWRSMPFIEPPFCERLGTPFALDLGPGLVSPAALADPPVFGRARAVARHDGPARDLVHRLKFSDRIDMAGPMGLWMARAGAGLTADADALVPVPLHPLRFWRRRYNQSMLLAQAISRHCRVPTHPDWLARVKATRPQVGLTRSERAENLQGSFRVPGGRRAQVAGARIVLVDDVLTTGATANAAARVLLRAGAARVDVLTFARVTLAP
ncbi:MAG: ComF family protein [Alsobacter sp.]